MTETQLLIKLVEAQGARLDALQGNYQVLNDHSIEWVQMIATVCTKVDIIMWITGVVLVVFIGLVIERLWTIKRNGDK